MADADARLSQTFAALADPTRRAILARLAQGEASVGEIAAQFALSLPTVSRHLKVLERAQLIARSTDAQWRRCRLRPEALRGAGEWIDRYRAYWEGRLDALAQLVENPAGRPRPRGGARKAARR